MGLLEDLSSGKYNLILFGILFIFIFNQYWNKNNESMADVATLTEDKIKELIYKTYLIDVTAIKNLSDVANKLQAGGLTVPGNLTVSGTVLSNSLAPVGSIIMWSGTNASLPSNWKFCDGSNGTPDLRGRFIMGTNRQLDGNTISTGPLNFWADRGTTGGSKDAILVSHSHSVNDPGHSHSFAVGQHNNWLTGTPTSMADNQRNGTINTNSVRTGISLSTEGSSGINANLPPYYVLAYIMRIS
jgi:hypothetical protein